MKYFFTLILILSFSASYTQVNYTSPDYQARNVLLEEDKVFWKKKIKQYAIQGGLILVSGAADGLGEYTYAHYSKFQKQFPNANPQYWNPAISWINKWDWDYENETSRGEKFFGSSTFLVATTDAYHLLRTIDRTTMITATSINLGQKQKWYWYLLDIVVMSAFRNIGFHLTYR